MIVPVMITLALCLCESVIFFSIATFFAMISGSGKMAGFLYSFLMLFPLAANSLASAILDRFLFGFGRDYDTNLSYISPVVHIMDRVSAGMDGHISPAYEHIIYYGMDVLLWTFVASVVVLILSFILYQKRPSESAANVFCFRIINPIFHYFIMMLSALIFGTFIYNLLFDSLWNTEYFKIIPIIGCMFVAGLIGYFVAKMITQKSFRVFKRAYIPVLVTAVFAALFCLTFSMDLTGVQGRVPDRAKIEYVDMRLNSDNLIVSESENPELVDEIRDLHQYVVDHADEYKKKSTVGYDEKKSVVDFSVTYTLRSGKTLSRSYEL
jgi:ABC-2 type transport system permease protein